MKYLVDKQRGECTYEAWSEGRLAHAWMSRELLGSAGVHSTYNATNKALQNTLLHSV